MRIEPFSPHDRSQIIKHLDHFKEWEGTRAGCRTRLVKYQVQGQPRIDYAVRVRSQTWVSDHANTVFDAIQEINRIIDTDRSRRVVPIRLQQEALC